MSITEYLNKYLADNGISRRAFAQSSGISPQYVNNICHGFGNSGHPLNPSVDICRKIAAATGVSVAELYSYLAPETTEPGKTEPKPEAAEVRKPMSIIDIEIEDYLPKLSTHQKELVLAYIKGMLEK